MSYQVQSLDTTFEAEQFQIGLFRKAGEVGRAKMMWTLTKNTRWMGWNGFQERQRHKNLPKPILALEFIKLLYGPEVISELEKDGKLSFKEGVKGVFDDDYFAAIVQVADVLAEIGVPYQIVGSVASSIHGIPRSTADVDLVAELKPEHVKRFIQKLGTDFYVSEQAFNEALAGPPGSFNLIHQGTMLKLDIIILRNDLFNQSSFHRARPARLSQSNPRLLMVNSPEDVLLHKLIWYRMSGQELSKQWLDVLGVLKTQEALDYAYLEKWAGWLGVEDLLAKARNKAGRD